MRHICLEVVSSYDNTHSSLAEINLIGEDGNPIPKDAWSVVYVNTEQPYDNPAENLFDELARRTWHSQWKNENNVVAFPHHIIFDLGEIQTVKGIELQQCNDNPASSVKDFKVYGRPQFFLF